jgi:uncharacterized membrane protein YgcG
MTMPFPINRFTVALALLALLIVANIINYFCSGWGLITVKVKDAPLGQVIKSIERQGWVTIYSNIDPQSKVTMYCDHVPLPEAMETLSVNVEEPPAADAGNGNGNGGGGRGGRGGGLGGGGGAQWHLAFFVAPTSDQVKAEVRSFTDGADRDDDSLRSYSFPTPLNMISDESTPVADPRLQTWPGVKLAPAPPPNADGTPATGPDGQPLQAEAAPTTVQGYLRSFAEGADVWIIAPTAWDSPVATAPPPDSSIAAAIRHFVSRANGSVTEAIILRGREQRLAGGDRPRGGGGGGFRGGGLDLDMMENRVDNAINGLPKEMQPAARAKLADEKQTQKEMATLPFEERRQKMMSHFIELRMNGDNNWRRSPEKRAQMYARLVNNRIAATGK